MDPIFEAAFNHNIMWNMCASEAARWAGSQSLIAGLIIHHHPLKWEELRWYNNNKRVVFTAVYASWTQYLRQHSIIILCRINGSVHLTTLFYLFLHSIIIGMFY